jgi:hypothetical protein
MYNVDLSRPGVLASEFEAFPLAYYMRAERPKVLYNEQTSKYVMWMYADTFDRTQRYAAVATSCWPSGPYTFLKVVHPDRNENITDFTLFQNATGAAFIARTYYQNRTYSMPRPIMQPTWESVKSPGSTPAAPIVDHAMTYHRALYDVGYDNFQDVYTQRWRQEDREWLMTSGNYRETLEFQGSDFQFVLTDITTGLEVARAAAPDREVMLIRWLGPDADRLILGQVR